MSGVKRTFGQRANATVVDEPRSRFKKGLNLTQSATEISKTAD